MPFSITFVTNDNKVVSVAEKANLLRTSIREKGGIPFKCGAGICGTCKCKIESGLENTDAIKDRERNHLSEADFAAGHRMACQTFVSGDITQTQLNAVARRLNERPRETLDWRSPYQALRATVASTS